VRVVLVRARCKWGSNCDDSASSTWIGGRGCEAEYEALSETNGVALEGIGPALRGVENAKKRGRLSGRDLDVIKEVVFGNRLCKV
jgi:hypothetical protein